MNKNKSRGFGDSVDKFTTKTGIKKVVEKVIQIIMKQIILNLF